MSKKQMREYQLGEIPTVVAPPEPAVKLSAITLEDPAVAEEWAEKVKEVAAKVGQIVTQHLAELDKYRSRSTTAQQYDAPKVKTLLEEIEALLDDKTLAYRKAAWMAFLSHHFNPQQKLETREALEAHLRKLVQDGRLDEVKDTDFHFRVYNRYYKVSSDSLLETGETSVLNDALENLVTRVWQQERSRRNEGSKGLFAQSELSFSEFLAGKNGRFCFSVPPEKGFLHDGTEIWRSGGVLLVETVEGRVWPLVAVGNPRFQQSTEEAVRKEAFIYHKQLFDSRVPSPDVDDNELIAKVRFLWNAIRRGIRRARTVDKDYVNARREEFGKRATISDAEFFLERKDGVALVDYLEPWKCDDDEEGVPNVFFLVQRKEGRIRIVEYPDHLTDLLEHCFGTAFEEQEGSSHFVGVPQPLRAILKATFGQVQKAAPTN